MTLFKNAKGASRASSRGMLALLILCFGFITPCLAVELIECLTSTGVNAPGTMFPDSSL